MVLHGFDSSWLFGTDENIGNDVLDLVIMMTDECNHDEEN